MCIYITRIYITIVKVNILKCVCFLSTKRSNLIRNGVFRNYYMWISAVCRTDKKKNLFSSYIRIFRRARLQSHIWLMASSYMVKYVRISSYTRSHSSSMTLQPIPSEFPYTYIKKISFSSLSVRTAGTGFDSIPVPVKDASLELCTAMRMCSYSEKSQQTNKNINI